MYYLKVLYYVRVHCKVKVYVVYSAAVYWLLMPSRSTDVSVSASSASSTATLVMMQPGERPLWLVETMGGSLWGWGSGYTSTGLKVFFGKTRVWRFRQVWYSPGGHGCPSLLSISLTTGHFLTLLFLLVFLYGVHRAGGRASPPLPPPLVGPPWFGQRMMDVEGRVTVVCSTERIIIIQVWFSDGGTKVINEGLHGGPRPWNLFIEPGASKSRTAWTTSISP